MANKEYFEGGFLCLFIKRKTLNSKLMFFEEDNDDVCVGSSLRKKKVQKIKFVSSLFLVVFTLRGCTFLYSYPLLGAVGTKGISANL